MISSKFITNYAKISGLKKCKMPLKRGSLKKSTKSITRNRVTVRLFKKILNANNFVMLQSLNYLISDRRGSWRAFMKRKDKKLEKYRGANFRPVVEKLETSKDTINKPKPQN